MYIVTVMNRAVIAIIAVMAIKAVITALATTALIPDGSNIYKFFYIGCYGNSCSYVYNILILHSSSPNC